MYEGQASGASTLLSSLLAGAQLRKLRVEESRPPASQPRPVLVLHAAARPEAPGCRRPELRAVREAALAAYRKLLLRDAPATEACEVALRHLEHHFHRQQRRQEDQQQELMDEAAATDASRTGTGARHYYADAAIVEGSNLRYGSVGGAKNYPHPISLARYVMKNTRQILVVGEEADVLATKLDEDEKHENNEELDGTSEGNSSLLDDDGFADKQSCLLEECPNKGEGRDGTEPAGTRARVTIALDENSEENETPLELAASYSVAALDHLGNLACATSSFRWADDDNGDPSCQTCNSPPRKTSSSSSTPGGWLSAGATIPGCGLALEESGCASFTVADDRALFGLAPAHSLLRSLSQEMLLPSTEPHSPDGPRSRCSGSSPVGLLLERELQRLPNGMAAGAVLLEAERGSVHVRSRGPPGSSFPWAYCADRKMFHGCAPGEARCRRLGDELVPPTPPPSLAGKRDLGEKLCKVEAGCPCGSAP